MTQYCIGFTREEEAERWARQALKLDVRHEPFFRAAAIVDEQNDFVCVLILTNFTKTNVDASIALRPGVQLSPKCALALWRQMGQLVFGVLKAKRITALVRGKNEMARKFANMLKFKPEGVMRKAFGDDDLFVFGLLDDEYLSHPWSRRSLK